MVIHIDRPFFFDTVRGSLFKGALNQPQVEGMTAILDFWEDRMPDTDPRWLAYIMATAYHETAYAMQPVRETLAATDARAIEILENAYAGGKLSWVKTPYWRPDEDGKSWLGRGLVQLTHKRNYEAMSRLTGIDLVAEPDRAMEMDAAVSILIEGMVQGSFATHKLADHLNETTDDWINARRIVNGTDRAEKLAGYGKTFLAAIRREQPKGRLARLKAWLVRAIARIFG
ncbi:Chitinase class I [Rhizobium tibeticum]|uniref:Chitinase class I n=1 Tax=Rhizobium tibeticum TaxID=501024 RepID=A0A1H8G238_9HYPH|nr:glycoside hydrolase family 19 protein [Rhizobium tibeticum]SEH58269.1 putative chitinase [Rhizobium tibeticum]SEN37834.1 Chitinase class I [Rhizobium tibeticum]